MAKFSLFHEEIFSAKKSAHFARRGAFAHREGRQPLALFYLFLFIIFFLLVGKLFFLTIVYGDQNRKLSEENRVKLIGIEAARGKILDRNGIVLAQSDEVYEKKKGDQISRISKQEADALFAKGLAGEDFVGEEGKIEREVVRNYKLGEESAHILGYTSILQKGDLENAKNMAPDAKVGRLGVEAAYDNFLRGSDGKKLIEVDANGQKVSILGRQEPKEGKSIQLSVDENLQKAAFEATLRGAEKAGSKRGAVVVQNPNTGEILALASVPSFDPTDVGKSVANADKPFLNRVTDGTYPPGSVFKIVTAFAGLESKAINKDTQIEDVGEFEIAGIKFPNWYFLGYGRTEGNLKIDRAIARSNDIFFYRTAERAGLDAIRIVANRLGFGQKTGIDLPDEALGLVPGKEWKKLTQNDNWYLGDTMHLGIGQGFMLVTPMQINEMTAFMAAGKIVKPHIVTKIGEEKIEPKEILNMFVARENFDLVRDGMRQACLTGGTGWPFFEAKYSLGCKTGTAERGLGDPHAWFTAFAPFDRPQIAITVIIEDGGEGSSVAGPVAKEILDWYFQSR